MKVGSRTRISEKVGQFLVLKCGISCFCRGAKAVAKVPAGGASGTLFLCFDRCMDRCISRPLRRSGPPRRLLGSKLSIINIYRLRSSIRKPRATRVMQGNTQDAVPTEALRVFDTSQAHGASLGQGCYVPFASSVFGLPLPAAEPRAAARPARAAPGHFHLVEGLRVRHARIGSNV